MYNVNGDFGEVRHFHVPPIFRTNNDYYIPFSLNSIGWHKCNDLYKITRDDGCEGHLFLISKSNGGMVRFGDFKPIKIPENSILWIPPHMSHSYYTEKGKIWEFYWFSIGEDENIDFSKIMKENYILELSDANLYFKDIEYLLRNRNLDIKEYLTEASRVISDIYHRIILNNISLNRKQDELIERIIKRMEEHCDFEWNLPELAKEYYISGPQLIRRFKEFTDMTPHAYLLNIRLRKAITYIHHTNLQIEEISQKVGFSSVSNFIRQFSKHYGITPNKYRQIQ